MPTNSEHQSSKAQVPLTQFLLPLLPARAHAQSKPSLRLLSAQYLVPVRRLTGLRRSAKVSYPADAEHLLSVKPAYCH